MQHHKLIRYTYIDEYVVLGARVDVHAGDLGAEAGRHSPVHLVAGSGEFAGQLEVLLVGDAEDHSESKGAGQEAGQVLLERAWKPIWSLILQEWWALHVKRDRTLADSFLGSTNVTSFKQRS